MGSDGRVKCEFFFFSLLSSDRSAKVGGGSSSSFLVLLSIELYFTLSTLFFPLNAQRSTPYFSLFGLVSFV